MSEWHVRLDGETKGPFSDEELKTLCETGDLSASSLTWKSDYPDWKPLSETDFVYKTILMPGYYSTENLSIWEYFTRAIQRKYVTFAGRATRKEYWSFVLFNVIFLFLSSVLA